MSLWTKRQHLGPFLSTSAKTNSNVLLRRPWQPRFQILILIVVTVLSAVLSQTTATILSHRDRSFADSKPWLEMMNLLRFELKHTTEKTIQGCLACTKTDGKRLHLFWNSNKLIPMKYSKCSPSSVGKARDVEVLAINAYVQAKIIYIDFKLKKNVLSNLFYIICPSL